MTVSVYTVVRLGEAEAYAEAGQEGKKFSRCDIVVVIMLDEGISRLFDKRFNGGTACTRFPGG